MTDDYGIFVKLTSINDLYVLMPRKKLWVDGNVTLDIGLKILKYSFWRGKFMEHTIDEFDLFRLEYYKDLIEKGLIYARREALDRSEKFHRDVEQDECIVL